MSDHIETASAAPLLYTERSVRDKIIQSAIECMGGNKNHIYRLAADCNELEDQRDEINAKLDAEMATSAALREHIKLNAGNCLSLQNELKDRERLLEEVEAERDAAIAERDRLREDVEHGARKAVAAMRTLLSSMEASNRSNVRAERAERDLADTKLALGARAAECDSLAKLVEELEADAFTIAHAIVAEDMKKLYAVIAANKIDIGLAKHAHKQMAERLKSCEAALEKRDAQIANATSIMKEARRRLDDDLGLFEDLHQTGWLEESEVQSSWFDDPVGEIPEVIAKIDAALEEVSK